MKRIVLIGAALLAFVGLACTPVAGAVSGPELFLGIPKENAKRGSGAGRLEIPQAIATDPEGHRVYVSDGINERIDVFGPWGEFIEAIGWGVKNGVSELQSCTKSSGCQKGVTGGGKGQFKGLEGIAIDSSGALYVAERGNHRVQKFGPAGEFLLMFGGDVNKTKVEEVGSTEAERNLCTAASGNVCQAGATGTGKGQFKPWVFGNLIAIGAGDSVYVGDTDRIQVFKSDGTYKEEIKFAEVNAKDPEFPPSGESGSLAIDPVSGDLYFAFRTAISSPPNVTRLSPAGVVKGTLEVVKPTAIAVDPEGTVYVIEHSTGSHSDNEVVEFDSSGKEVVRFDQTERLLDGLGTNRIGDLYVGTTTASEGFLSVYGPLPSEITPAPEVPPTITDQYPISATSTGAVLKARINPHFFGSTTYYVEYGLAPCKEGGCNSTPAPPGLPLGGGETGIPLPTSGVPISGLKPSTTYHFRFVAISGGFEVKGAGEDSEEEPEELEGSFTTRPAGTPVLPDGRAYEKVSPADKNSGDAGPALPPLGGFTEDTQVRPLQASPSGDAITFSALAAFGGAEGGPAASQYLSRRGSSAWTSENVTPAARSFSLRDPVRGFSTDLSKSAVVQFDPPLVPGAPAGVENLYLRHEGGALTLLTPEAPLGSSAGYCIGFGGASAGFGRMIFMATGVLTPDAIEGPGQSLYEWSTAEGLQLVSILPNGSSAPPSSSSGFGSITATCQGAGNARHAISEDGSRIFWSYGGTSEGAAQPLFARLNGTETIQLDATQGGPGPGGGGNYWAASGDGSVVFFTDQNKLTPGSSAGDLYRYDFNVTEGERLADLSSAGPKAAEVQGVLGASEDGAAIYFAAKGVLSGEEQNSEGQKAQAGQPNIYRWSQADGIRYVATANAATDGTDWAIGSFQQTARVTSNGGLLAFGSTAPLTGFDSTDQTTGKADSQIFLYDAVSEVLTCASCNPTGARPIGPSTMPVWSTPFQQPRGLSEGAVRLFYQSEDALALKDVNGKQDVYQFEAAGNGTCTPASPTYSEASSGCQDLISSGESGDNSYFDEASVSGGDVFFSTRQRLLPPDRDEHYDIYDARIGGGLPEPPPTLECVGEACRPAVAPPGAPPPPGSSILQGPGNSQESRKHKKHKKKHHRQTHHPRKGGSK